LRRISFVAQFERPRSTGLEDGPVSASPLHIVRRRKHDRYEGADLAGSEDSV